MNGNYFLKQCICGRFYLNHNIYMKHADHLGLQITLACRSHTKVELDSCRSPWLCRSHTKVELDSCRSPWLCRGARGVMVIVAGYGHGDMSSNPGPD